MIKSNSYNKIPIRFGFLPLRHPFLKMRGKHARTFSNMG